MPNFAHTESGFAQDVHQDNDLSIYQKRFATDLVASWTCVQVPDDVQSGAKDNGDGTFTNPSPPSIPIYVPQPLPLTKSQFQTLYAANGNDLTQTLDNWPTG